MAITRRAIVSMFLHRKGGVESLARRYSLPIAYVEDCLRGRITGRKVRRYKRKDYPQEQMQMTIAQVYGEISV